MGFLKLLVLFCFTACSAELDHCSKPLDGLVVTWALPANINSNPYAFNPLPRTTGDAEAQNWTKLDDGCANPNLQHKGQRYILGDDLSVITVYDKKGHIAGVHRSIPKDVADKVGVVDFAKLAYADQETINGHGRYVFKVYFIDPEIICTGRSHEEFEAQGTMAQVYIKNGPDSYLQPPNEEDKSILKAQKWSDGLCVKTMGTHYYLDAYKDMNCANEKPYFLTYNCGRLVSVGMFLMGKFTQEPRYELVPSSILKMFISPVPDCLYEVPAISAMHMYFTKEPLKIPCP